jgi:fructose-1,6-bisphosphatase/inositol monophosphatase family enzyme
MSLSDLRELENMGYEFGMNVVHAVKRLKRGSATNEEWGARLETASENEAKRILGEFAESHDYQFHFITMPFKSKSIVRGDGFDKIEQKVIGKGQKQVACVYDTVDSTWNAKAGINYTVSTIMAFSDALEEIPEKLTIGDFYVGVVAPWVGDGIYLGVRGSKSYFKSYDGMIESLRLTKETSPEKIRVMIDLFPATSKQRHDKAVDIVSPIIKEWLDFGRLYGSGVELMSFLGRYNAEPPYGGYVAIDQKSDNLIAPSIILECAGAIFTDWDGNQIKNRRLEERINVVMAANSQIHNSLLNHLKGH